MRAEDIAARNRVPPPRHGGFAGFFEAVGSSFDRRTFKRKAAETLAYIPVNRDACLELGLNHHKADAVLLNRAAMLRRKAARIGGACRRTGPHPRKPDGSGRE